MINSKLKMIFMRLSRVLLSISWCSSEVCTLDGCFVAFILRFSRALRDLYGCAIHVEVGVRGWRCRGRHNSLNYVIFIMRAQYRGLLDAVQDSHFHNLEYNKK